MTRNIVKVGFFKAGKYNSYRLADGMKILRSFFSSLSWYFYAPSVKHRIKRTFGYQLFFLLLISYDSFREFQSNLPQRQFICYIKQFDEREIKPSFTEY